ncbi:MAG: FixH family protein [Saprospiraceae bacterium]
MKFNFGHGIFVFYVFFVVTLGYQVYKSTTIDHSLVASNYYEQDLAFQKTLDARNRAVEVPVVLQQMDDGQLQLQFLGDDVPSGAQLLLMRPDSKMEDVLVDLTKVSKVTKVETPTLLPGRWRARLEWEVGAERVVKDYTLYLN